jgi:hypothetical protein
VAEFSFEHRGHINAGIWPRGIHDRGAGLFSRLVSARLRSSNRFRSWCASRTDAIAATAVARRVGLPRRITNLLEGESLVNDASSLVALEFAVATMVSNQVPTIGAGLSRLVYLVAAGVLVGLFSGARDPMGTVETFRCAN